MKIAPLADVKARLILAHSPRFQALLDESRRSILAGKRRARGAFWKAMAARQRKKNYSRSEVFLVSTAVPR